MKKDAIFYAISTVSFLLVSLAPFFIPMADITKGAFNTTSIVFLFGIALEAWRDKRSFERQVDLQEKQQDYSLAIASHMAITVFDHQVKFCERYFGKAIEALNILFANGPTEQASAYARDLFLIRIESAAWISTEIEKGLLPFEQGLREIGSSAQLADMDLPNPEHARFVDISYRTFLRALNLSDPSQDQSAEGSIAFLASHLRSVLRITELTEMRDQAIKTAKMRTGG